MDIYHIAIGPSSFADADETPLKLLQAAGVEVRPNPYGRRLTEEEIVAHLDGVDGLIAGLEPLNKRVLENSVRLKAIARVGIGLDNVDLESAAVLGIKVSNTPEGPTEAVAELYLTALLCLSRQVILFNRDMHAGMWKKRLGFGLRGTRVLLVGYGRIGKRFGEMLRVFGSEILVVDPALTQDMLTCGERLVSLEEGLQEAEVISLHASGRDAILGKEEFRIMPPGTILLNGARGELVDEEALIRALEKKRVSAAWFDTFCQEPYDGALGRFDQVLLTPHIATYTRQCRRTMEAAAVRNLLGDLGITPSEETNG